MPAEWPLDKLSLVNSALAETGNNLCAAPDDGSDEWTVCSSAYERAMAVLLEEGSYGFGTKVATINPSPTAPTDTDWDTAYPLPADLLHLIWVKLNPSGSAGMASLTRWDILDGQVVLNAQGGPPPPDPPATPGLVTIKYVSLDNSDAQNGTPLFVAALTAFVMSGIYRGLHGDAGEAGKLWQYGEQLAQRSRSRYDMQKPKRQFWRPRITDARRGRRPWPLEY